MRERDGYTEKMDLVITDGIYGFVVPRTIRKDCRLIGDSFAIPQAKIERQA